MRKRVILFLLCATMLRADTIKVAMAANVSYASKELVAAFNETHPNTKVQVTIGGSGKLIAQIRHGISCDIFMSADMKYPQSLYDARVGITKPVVYIRGALALFSAKKFDLERGITVVTQSDVRRVAIANPKTAPYGKATIEALQNAKIDIKSKTIYGESIAQTISYAMTAADMGFVAKSSLYSPQMTQYKKDINWIDIDTKLYTPIDQGIVILKQAANNPEVRAFYDFILSADAKRIFKKYGYIVAP